MVTAAQQGSGGLEGPGTEPGSSAPRRRGRRGGAEGAPVPAALSHWIRKEAEEAGSHGACEGPRPGQSWGKECSAASESLRVRRGTGRGTSAGLSDRRLLVNH